MEWVEGVSVEGVVRRRIRKGKRRRERECVKEKWEGEEGNTGDNW